MSKDFLSEVRRLKDGSLHTGTVESITVDVESSSSTDSSAPEQSNLENADPPSNLEEAEAEETVSAALNSEVLHPEEEKTAEDAMDSSAGDASSEPAHETAPSKQPISVANLPGVWAEPATDEQMGEPPVPVGDRDIEITIASERVSEQTEGVTDAAAAPKDAAVLDGIKLPNQHDSSEMNSQSKAPQPAPATLQIESLKAELHEALHHEERLEKRLDELGAQLKEKEKSLAHLQLELGQAQRSNALLSDELAEAKQYILKLSNQSDADSGTQADAQAKVTPKSSVSTASTATTASTSSAAKTPSNSSSAPSDRHLADIQTSAQTSAPSTQKLSAPNSQRDAQVHYPRPLSRPAATPSPRARTSRPGRPMGHLNGLPPMSTEQLTGSAPARRSPQPQPLPRTSSRSPAQPPPRTREPLHLPERKSAPAKSGAAKPEPSKAEAASVSAKQRSIQRSPHPSLTRPGFSRPGLSNLNEDVPMVARDVEKKEVKPKLSDSEMGWFD